MCIFFVLNVENTTNAFLKRVAVRNSCSKGNIDRSKSNLAEADSVYILCSKCGKTPQILSYDVCFLSLPSEMQWTIPKLYSTERKGT